MGVTYTSNNINFSKYSYGSIAAKLSGYIDTNQKIRVINSFGYHDPGRNVANLSFLKQFGVVPLELNSRHGEININEFINLDVSRGITIYVESIYIGDNYPGREVSSSSQIEKISENVSKYDFSKTKLSGEHDLITQGHIDIISQQIQVLAKLIEAKHQDHPGEYLYISGFSFVSPIQSHNKITKTEFFPWYFELGNHSGMIKKFAQPELNVFVRNLSERPPQIPNLDDLIDSIGSDKPHH